MRILFMGTPDIAAESLRALLDAGHEVCAVFTRRDKPVGRKQILTAPPVKQLAQQHGILVYQPRTLRDGSSDELIRSLAPDVIVVVAYGCILPPQLLRVARYGCINLHVSLLPKYRGSAPVQWAVLNGDTQTGVSIMQLDEGLDTGDVLLVEPVAIDPEETSGQLFDRVSAVGAKTLVTALEKIEAGEAVYGLSEYTLDLFMEYEISSFKERYCNDTENEGMDLTEEEIREHYESREWIVGESGDKLELEEARPAVEQELREMKYDDMILRLEEDSQVETDREALYRFTLEKI